MRPQGAAVKIGASSVVSDTPVVIKGTMDAKKIKELLGLSPLSDAAMDSVANGSSRILCIPVAASTGGTVGTVSKTGTGTGSCAASGAPYNIFSVIVKITGKGSLNSALFQVSVDGGYSFSDELTIPLSGTYEIPSTGITLTFTAGTGENAETDSFLIGDTYSFSTTAPAMTNADVIAAIAKIRNLAETFELVHIVGESTADLWAAVAAEQLTLQNTYHKPELFVLEAYAPNQNETAEAYAARLIADRKNVKNYNIQVVSARSLYVRMDGTTREVNNAGIVCGLYAAAKPQQSIGQTNAFGISSGKMLGLRPAGIEDCISDLDEAGFLTFRRYDGLDGYFVTNARVMCPDGSDYPYAEDVRILNKIIRKGRAEALKQLQSGVDLEDVDGDLAAKAAFIQTPLDEMVRQKEISAVTVTVPPDQDVQKTEAMQVKVRYVSRGIVREIDIDVGQTTAAASAS
ncbi:DUF2586 domain-containing protein [Caproicibacter sp.]|uniref:DUF2586 domain-containing protein n=1 Tax=Caproicibacter sp. TaxID=2814884 RepID=UPI00398920D5